MTCAAVSVMYRIVLLASVVTACAGTISDSGRPVLDEDLPTHHEENAAAVGAPPTYQCGDTVLEDQATSGGVRITTFQPCWDFDEERTEREAAAAKRERAEARHEQVAAAAVASNDIAACLPILPGEREHSPFVHRKEISEIVPHREGSRLRGVWIVFKPVAGLTADWLRNDIECQHARWIQAGKDSRVMTSDPTLVDGADVQVFDRDGHVEVLVTTDSEEHAEIALARARHQAGPVAMSRSSGAR